MTEIYNGIFTCVTVTFVCHPTACKFPKGEAHIQVFHSEFDGKVGTNEYQ